MPYLWFIENTNLTNLIVLFRCSLLGKYFIVIEILKKKFKYWLNQSKITVNRVKLDTTDRFRICYWCLLIKREKSDFLHDSCS